MPDKNEALEEFIRYAGRLIRETATRAIPLLRTMSMPPAGVRIWSRLPIGIVRQRCKVIRLRLKNAAIWALI